MMRYVLQPLAPDTTDTHCGSCPCAREFGNNEPFAYHCKRFQGPDGEDLVGYGLERLDICRNVELSTMSLQAALDTLDDHADDPVVEYARDRIIDVLNANGCLYWYCDSCNEYEMAQPDYGLGDCEPCISCEGTSRVLTWDVVRDALQKRNFNV